MISLRARLLISTGLGMSCVLLAAGLALYAAAQSLIYRELDQSLIQKITTLAGLIKEEQAGIELEFAESDMEEFRRSPRPEYYEVWLADGPVLARSPSLNGSDLPQADGPVDAPAVNAVTLPDGRPGRLASLRFRARRDEEDPPSGPSTRLAIALARDVDDQRAALANLRLALVLVGLGATALSVGLLAGLVSLGLRPADGLARRIAAIDENRLSTRFESAAMPGELRPIAQCLNNLLERLEEAFIREKTLTANVAHELRTPLAGLRTTLEVALSREREGAVYRSALAECLAICRQTESMMEKLLALARLDAARTSQRKPLDLDEVLKAAWKPFIKIAQARALRVDWDVTPGLRFRSDEETLGLVFGNILDNAVHHTDAAGHVWISAQKEHGEICIRIENTGSAVAPADAARVFDRFWRGNQARSRDGAHCGLGLALCKTAVESLKGAIRAESREGRFVIALRLPTDSSAYPNEKGVDRRRG